MNDDDDAPVYPLLSYGTGIVDGAVALSLQLATDQEKFEAREGSWVSSVMTADTAIEFGKELIARGERAKAGASIN